MESSTDPALRESRRPTKPLETFDWARAAVWWGQSIRRVGVVGGSRRLVALEVSDISIR